VHGRRPPGLDLEAVPERRFRPGIGCYGFQIDAPDWTITVVMRGEAS